MPVKIKVEGVEYFWQMVETRMPFRYGSAKLVRCPHLYVVATIRDEQGRVSQGIAADNLPPKWFDKDSAKDYAQEITEQIQVIRWAGEAARGCALATPFRLWFEAYQAVQAQAARAALPKLLAGFGPSLIERSVNDAAAKLAGLSFFDYLHSDAPGVQLELLGTSLQGVLPRDILPSAPRDFIFARHTVGLSDPIRAHEIPADERLNDGLPQSLDEVIRFYGVRYLKIKVCNQLEHDIARLESIAALLDEEIKEDFVCTLDGNEQYEDFQQLLPLVEALKTRPTLRRLAASIEFIEQPLSRAYAFDAERCRDLRRASQHFPIIIDESDDAPDALPRALALGYCGTSHKNCKNTFKSLANMARLQREAANGRRVILSAEDLTNIGVVALQQDLTALSALGIAHAERNGHHYFRGLSHLPREVQIAATRALPQLYTENHELARLDIQNGRISVGALHTVRGMGVPLWPDVSACRVLDELNTDIFR